MVLCLTLAKRRTSVNQSLNEALPLTALSKAALAYDLD
jgi:hypothetical protein